MNNGGSAHKVYMIIDIISIATKSAMYTTYSVTYFIQFPGLMEILDECKSQKSYLIYMISHLAGFMIGFVILLLIAIYEEDINSLIE